MASRWAVVMFVCACAARPVAPSLLTPGAHPVGVRAAWTFDATRRYRTAFDDGATYGGAAGAPRPLLIHVWYPAARGGAPTSRAAYLQPPAPPEVHALAGALATYARGVTASEAFGADEAELSPALRQRFAAYLARPLTAVRDAPPARGRFPVVIYNAGAGSSYADNVELCEHLASHGYVVLGSAFLDPDGASLAPGEGWRDYDTLLAWARRLPFADATRAGGVGHSLGAQQLLLYASHGGRQLRAFALLDTTIDPHGIVEPFHAIVPELLAQRAAVRGALLALAPPEAVFAFLDQLTGADRTYVVVADQAHDEYIAHGVERSTLPDAPAARAPRVRASYRAIAGTVRAFFDRELRGVRVALPGEHVARGVDHPAPYDPAGAAPPSPHQLRGVLAAHGAAATIEILRAHRAADPDHPIYTKGEVAAELLYELVARGDRDTAIALFAYFRTVQDDLIPRLLLWGKLAAMFHRDRVAHLYGVTALTLAPDDAAARAFVGARP